MRAKILLLAACAATTAAVAADGRSFYFGAGPGVTARHGPGSAHGEILTWAPRDFLPAGLEFATDLSFWTFGSGELAGFSRIDRYGLGITAGYRIGAILIPRAGINWTYTAATRSSGARVHSDLGHASGLFAFGASAAVRSEWFRLGGFLLFTDIRYDLLQSAVASEIPRMKVLTANAGFGLVF